MVLKKTLWFIASVSVAWGTDFSRLFFPQSWITLKWKNSGWRFTPGSIVLFTKFAIFETFTDVFRVLSQTVLLWLVTTDLAVEALKHTFTGKNCHCHLLLLFKYTVGWPATILYMIASVSERNVCVFDSLFSKVLNLFWEIARKKLK